MLTELHCFQPCEDGLWRLCWHGQLVNRAVCRLIRRLFDTSRPKFRLHVQVLHTWRQLLIRQIRIQRRRIHIIDRVNLICLAPLFLACLVPLVAIFLFLGLSDRLFFGADFWRVYGTGLFGIFNCLLLVRKVYNLLLSLSIIIIGAGSCYTGWGAWRLVAFGLEIVAEIFLNDRTMRISRLLRHPLPITQRLHALLTILLHPMAARLNLPPRMFIFRGILATVVVEFVGLVCVVALVGVGDFLGLDSGDHL